MPWGPPLDLAGSRRWVSLALALALALWLWLSKGAVDNKPCKLFVFLVSFATSELIPPRFLGVHQGTTQHFTPCPIQPTAAGGNLWSGTGHRCPLGLALSLTIFQALEAIDFFSQATRHWCSFTWGGPVGTRGCDVGPLHPILSSFRHVDQL